VNANWNSRSRTVCAPVPADRRLTGMRAGAGKSGLGKTFTYRKGGGGTERLCPPSRGLFEDRTRDSVEVRVFVGRGMLKELGGRSIWQKVR